MINQQPIVIPAQAGIHVFQGVKWTPDFSEVTASSQDYYFEIGSNKPYSYELSPMSTTLPFEIISQKSPAVLVFMTIDAEVLPVRAISRIIKAIPILMMHSKQSPVFRIKFSSAFRADQTVYSERLFPVIGGRRTPLS
jgi:hypothetical protein